jgi:protein TonB
MLLRFSLPTGPALGVALLLFASIAARPAIAQTAPPAEAEKVIDNKVYTYVEHMPQIPGGGGNRAIVDAIQRNVTYPKEALRNNIQGVVFVSFSVVEDGSVHDAKIVKGIGWGCDETVLDAVRKLPLFVPGTQNGRAVSVNFTVPVTFRITEPVRRQRD